ncbi:hypothetical protein Asppvi_003724 [Aspergillus pseudoviridinutans]|uniref:Uncharacterized protein n=1 Tax=Aspergillus pseudoviridinutans TaxID=1517512 RepID=A0A9P3BAJ8_9EURO|nr:uncharacterized protein Asppvi_003724 [Aspergillus pseudoviridinutans]GIJ84873.1 hypothetical protein Asppvi_003724 [Aspergillus pseudoviridinutans]
MTISIQDEYAQLMAPNKDGHYLYKPQPFSIFHPGVIGYFDNDGDWHFITDISQPGHPESLGFTGLGRTLYPTEPKESMWKTRSSGSEAEASFGLTGGLSGAMTAAPMDVSANAKNKWGKTGKAALITGQVVVSESFKDPYTKPIEEWVKKNAKALVDSDYGADIKEYGLWAIQKTWSTQECAVTMQSAHNRDTSAGLDLGATGVGKIGGSGSSLVKGNIEGWTTYKAKPSEIAYVVSYAGPIYRLHSIQMFRSNPLKQIQKQASDDTEYCKPVYDENGNQTGFEFFRPVYDENGKQIGEKKIDREAEEKQREEERKKLEEEANQLEEDFYVESAGTIGLTDSDDEAEEQEARVEEEKRKEIMKKVAVINQIPDEEQKRAELLKLMEERLTVTTTTESVTM